MNVEYRLYPEASLLTPYDDGVAAVEWIKKHKQLIGYNNATWNNNDDDNNSDNDNDNDNDDDDFNDNDNNNDKDNNTGNDISRV